MGDGEKIEAYSSLSHQKIRTLILPWPTQGASLLVVFNGLRLLNPRDESVSLEWEPHLDFGRITVNLGRRGTTSCGSAR